MSFMTKRSNTSIRLKKSYAKAFDAVLRSSHLVDEVAEKYDRAVLTMKIVKYFIIKDN